MSRGDIRRRISVKQDKEVLSIVYSDVEYSKIRTLIENSLDGGTVSCELLLSLTRHLRLPEIVPLQKDVDARFLPIRNAFEQIRKDFEKIGKNFELCEFDHNMCYIETSFEMLCEYSEQVLPQFRSENICHIIKKFQGANGREHEPVPIKYTDFVNPKRATCAVCTNSCLASNNVSGLQSSSDLVTSVLKGSEETEPQVSHRSSCEPDLSQLDAKDSDADRSDEPCGKNC